MASGFFSPLISVLVSLLVVYFSFRYFVYYSSLTNAKVGIQDRNRRLMRIAQFCLLVSILAFTGSLVNLFNRSETAVLPTATTTPVVDEVPDLSIPGAGLAPPTPSISPLILTASLEGSPTPEVLPGVGFALIGNTNGFGVYVRSAPGLQYEMVTQLSDGTRVELTGEVQTADGFNWQSVRLEDGRLGWIAESFLIPEP